MARAYHKDWQLARACSLRRGGEVLVLVSLDGLRPQDYLSPSSPAAFLRELAHQGAFARSVRPIYPSLTFSCHATLVTGVRCARHGITGNTRLGRPQRWRNGESDDWFLEEKSFTSPTLWRVASEAGLLTLILRWPTTVGAPVEWLVPEVFALRGTARSPYSDWNLLEAHTDPGLLGELNSFIRHFHPPIGPLAMDDWVATCAVKFIPRRHPDLTLIHLTSLDHARHDHGTDSPEAVNALVHLDALTRRIVEGLDSATFLVFGDHGFRDFRYRIHINALLGHHGWLRAEDGRVQEWRAIAHTNCSEAAIYVRDPGDLELVRDLLVRMSPGLFHILEREELDTLGAWPGAALALSAAGGYSMGQHLDGPMVEEIAGVRGEHGYLPDSPGMRTGLMAYGAGIPGGMDLGELDLRDIAPTAAWMLGLELPGAEGRVIEALVASSRRAA